MPFALRSNPNQWPPFTRISWRRLSKLDLAVKIYRKPNEVPEPIRFDQDETHRAYDREYANRFWRILVQADRVFKQFRARFIGKCSPVHFFWGSPDLAVTRFSGRSAPEHPGGIPNLPDWVTREAYSQEVSSCGFWPGGGPIPYAAFYSYAYPEPSGFAAASVQPGAAFYSSDLREFILPVPCSSNSQSRRIAYCSSSYKPPMTLPRISDNGIAVRSNLVAARRVQPSTAPKVLVCKRLHPKMVRNCESCRNLRTRISSSTAGAWGLEKIHAALLFVGRS